ncbi:J domain-containing protein [Cupriavidus taiwanensis]|uniref:J domain-containing protein n=1 Tax=Cupriavidus taiwanensis TaxID=164546 RepID=UPI000E1079DB|nr:DnaJ domain-containing protein [Cupriavidus taiwanensis]SOY52706.1 hypothetical protein CBM2592_A280127 [Cupriavidus taiwanensis]SOY85785.1 hypothetical protein CBM2591_A320127 [Cupriavidus taiwanensis]SPA15657.1 hypothetical protein CBM2631_A320030 [Cupriavidus taiwanensis]SPD44897.1 conserved protein of unknown function [Cupriavidus taiwanensis]
MTENYYGVLGVREDASVTEIKAAYRYAAAKVHPAHGENSPSDAAHRFARLAEAYSVLSDETARGAYDVQRHPGGSYRFANARSRAVDPEATFVNSMVEWAVELRGQGYTGELIRDLLVSHQCPVDIAEAVSAMFGTSGSLPGQSQATPMAAAGYAAGKTVGTLRRDSNGVLSLLGIVVVLAGVLYLMPKESSKGDGPNATEAGVAATSPASTPASVSASGPEERAAPGPYSFLSSVVELRTLDATRGTAVRTKDSFRLPAGESLPEAEQGIFNTEVALRVPLPFGARVLYLLQSIPVQTQSYDCHACATVVSAIITTRSKAGEEIAATPLQDLGMMGAWGKYDLSSVALVEIGKKHPGLVFRHEWGGQGVTASSIDIFSIEQKGIRKLAEVTTGGSNTGTSQCGSQKSACEEFNVSVRFARDNKSLYYPLELKVTGTRMNDSGVAAPVSGTFLARFNGKSYVTDPDQGAPSPASGVSAPADGTPGTRS